LSFRLPWFRRKKQDEQQQDRLMVAAPSAAPEAEAPQEDAGEPGPEGPATKKRRRGTRGGRGRKKATGQAPAPEPAAKSESPPAKPERRQKSADRGGRAATRRRVAPKRAALPAARRELLVSVSVTEQRVAVLEDGRVAEVYLERPERRSITGNIYLGSVDNVLPGMEAAFVEIGLEKNGFLYVDEIVLPELEGKRHGKKIQDLIARGQTILVQAVKDPMKSKGARLTTDISLPGRFVVFVPNGEGVGVSRRLPDDERSRLKEIMRGLDVPQGGLIVRTAAEGASAEDVERDVTFLQRLWKTIEARAKTASAPELVYQEAELPLRVVRDLFTGDFERAVIDHDRTHKRIVGYLRKTSPHMVEKLERYREKAPLFEAHGVDAEINSTLSRRVDLPSGGYLIFDYAEAFTVIDVNTGRFVGGRGKGSNSRLEDTITKNNLEAVKEVVRQLRLRDIGGIIVIDFIDMANPKNRQTVEEALRNELERDRTKTYVVEISPLGLVEMTRQNVTDGPREILTKRCPTCAGDGIVISEQSAAVEAERRLRALAAGTRAQAFRVELHPRVAGLLVGPAAERLAEIEAQTRRRFYFKAAADGHGLQHFEVLEQGKREQVAPTAPVAEGQELRLELVEVGLHDPSAGVGKVDGYDVCVAGAAKQVGKKVRARIERVLDDTAYASWLGAPAVAGTPITAEAEAEKPTRKPRAAKAEIAEEAEETEEPTGVALEAGDVETAPGDEAEEAGAEPADGEEKPKKRTRRGSRGGRGRKKVPAAAAGGENEAVPAADGTDTAPEAHVGDSQPAAAETGPAAAETEPAAAVLDGKRAPRIHVPDDRLGRGDEEAAPETAPPEAAQAGEPPAPEQDEAGEEADDETSKKRTRRGTRGGRNRRKKPAPVGAAAAAPEPAETPDANSSDFEYVPMSQWEEDVRG
jgi:ribonuclease G